MTTHRTEYIARINRVIDYIEANLDQELSLPRLAEVANFSQFHFHRLFRTIVGETLKQFIQRVRVEKAAMQLLLNPTKSITEIAFDCGFSSPATFARAFKNNFHMSATEWRSGGHHQHSKIRKTNSKIEQAIGMQMVYSEPVLHNQNLMWRITMNTKYDVQIEVKEMPVWSVAYVRHIGPYQGNSQLFENLFNKLMAWAAPRGLLQFPKTQLFAVYYDNPDITDDDKLRVDICLTVPPDTEADGEIGRMDIPGGQFAVGHFEIDAHEYGEAWQLLLGQWMPESGYQPDDRLCYEQYLNNPKEHPENKHVVDICMPVKPL